MTGVPVQTVIILTVVLIVVFDLVLVGIVKALLHVPQPDEALVVTGRTHRGPDGAERGYRVLLGEGRALRLPVLESAEVLPLNAVPITTPAIDTPAGLRRVHAVVAVSAEPDRIHAAVERFLGAEKDIPLVAENTLRDHLARGADPATFRDTVEPILGKLGLTAISAHVVDAEVVSA